MTVSLDGLDDAVFRAMNDVDFPVADVLRGIEAAQAVGLGPIKVNMVVKRGTNDRPDPAHGAALQEQRHRAALHRVHGRGRHQRLAHGRGAAQRRGGTNASTKNCRWCSWIPAAPGETAERWGYADGSGEIGVISSVTQAFCGDCNRARLSTEGQLYLCLFATHGHDLRPLIRGSSNDEDLASAIGAIWQGRSDRYSQLRASLPPDQSTGGRRVEMSYIGG